MSVKTIVILTIVVVGIVLVQRRFSPSEETRIAILGVFISVLNIAGFFGFLLVVSPVVPYAAKDGSFGSVGGLMGGAFVGNLLLLVWYAVKLRRQAMARRPNQNAHSDAKSSS